MKYGMNRLAWSQYGEYIDAANRFVSPHIDNEAEEKAIETVIDESNIENDKWMDYIVRGTYEEDEYKRVSYLTLSLARDTTVLVQCLKSDPENYYIAYEVYNKNGTKKINKTFQVKKDIVLNDFMDAIVAYNYLSSKKKEDLTSDEFHLGHELDNYFTKLRYGTTKTLTIDIEKHIGKEKFEDLKEKSRVWAMTAYLINKNVIRNEGTFRKYPATLEEFQKIAPREIEKQTEINIKEYNKLMKDQIKFKKFLNNQKDKLDNMFNKNRK